METTLHHTMRKTERRYQDCGLSSLAVNKGRIKEKDNGSDSKSALLLRLQQFALVVSPTHSYVMYTYYDHSENQKRRSVGFPHPKIRTNATTCPKCIGRLSTVRSTDVHNRVLQVVLAHLRLLRPLPVTSLRRKLSLSPIQRYFVWSSSFYNTRQSLYHCISSLPHRVSLATMSKLFLFFIFPIVTFISTAVAFTPQPRVFSASKSFTRTTLAAVTDIGSEAAFDKTIKNAGSSLVIVDYSTTWCGPCKGRLNGIKYRYYQLLMIPLTLSPLNFVFIIQLSHLNLKNCRRNILTPFSSRSSVTHLRKPPNS